MNAALRVFIIDDEQPMRIAMSRLLGRMGLASESFDSAESFLQQYGGNSGRECLLVDIRMPGMSGLDLIEELERRGIALPAIVMTGHADPNTTRRMQSLRTLGCLEKPFSVAQLKELLDRWWATLESGDPPWRRSSA